MQSQTGQDTQRNTKFIILYLFKCLDSKKLYFRVEVSCQIHTCIPVPKKAAYKKDLLYKEMFYVPKIFESKAYLEYRSTIPCSKTFCIAILSNKPNSLTYIN